MSSRFDSTLEKPILDYLQENSKFIIAFDTLYKDICIRLSKILNRKTLRSTILQLEMNAKLRVLPIDSNTFAITCFNDLNVDYIVEKPCDS